MANSCEEARKALEIQYLEYVLSLTEGQDETSEAALRETEAAVSEPEPCLEFRRQFPHEFVDRMGESITGLFTLYSDNVLSVERMCFRTTRI